MQNKVSHNPLFIPHGAACPPNFKVLGADTYWNSFLQGRCLPSGTSASHPDIEFLKGKIFSPCS